jgi:hypothetical protein
MRDFIVRQWQGKLSLPISFWAMGALEKLLELFLRKAGICFITLADNAWTVLIVLFVFYGITEPVSIWWWVGAWRSAKRRTPQFAINNWSGLARAAILIFALIDIAGYKMIAWPQFSNAVLDIADDPEWGHRGIKVKANGTELEIYGYITYSVENDLRQEILSHPTVSLITLDSFGGRMGPALAVNEIISEHKFDTLVDQACISACTIAFLGGRHRWATSNARFGFHSASYGGEIAQAADEQFSVVATNSGVSRSFLARALASKTVWYPSVSELKRAGVVTNILPTER